MSDVNTVIITGRITHDCELRYTTGGFPVIDISVASNRFYKSKKSDKTEKETVFMDCTLWGKQGEALAGYLKKGQLVSIEGRLAVDNWQDKEGNNRRKVFIHCNTVNLLGPKSSSNLEDEDLVSTSSTSNGDVGF
jgi:single-strand DNA-binding protein